MISAVIFRLGCCSSVTKSCSHLKKIKQGKATNLYVLSLNQQMFDLSDWDVGQLIDLFQCSEGNFRVGTAVCCVYKECYRGHSWHLGCLSELICASFRPPSSCECEIIKLSDRRLSTQRASEHLVCQNSVMTSSSFFFFALQGIRLAQLIWAINTSCKTEINEIAWDKPRLWSATDARFDLGSVAQVFLKRLMRNFLSLRSVCKAKKKKKLMKFMSHSDESNHLLNCCWFISSFFLP